MLQLTSGSNRTAPSADHPSEFQQLYERVPIRAIKLFFCYLNAHGLDRIADQMAVSVTPGTLYIEVLMEAGSPGERDIPHDIAANVMPLLPLADPQFLIKFARMLAAKTEPESILQAMRLVPALGDYSILIPWLRSLESHSDGRLRARAAKLLCLLRPNPGLIQRHLQSTDPRIRAGVMEALWQVKNRRFDSTAWQALRSGVQDSNHRVVANALVGLYQLGESQALEKMIALCSTKQHLFRAAMAWAMGVVDDSRAVPSLQALIHDPSFTVRKRAADSLLALGYSINETHPIRLYR